MYDIQIAELGQRMFSAEDNVAIVGTLLPLSIVGTVLSTLFPVDRRNDFCDLVSKYTNLDTQVWIDMDQI